MNDRREAFGGMELIGRLSSGGMGEVLLARRRGAHGFEKLVAVKTIRFDLNQRDDIRRMFLDEARLMARLDHPAITQVYDFGEHNDVLFLAMEYVPGVVLNRLLKKRGERLPESVAARIAIQVAHGLHAAHELVDGDGRSLGVVHRDVSPHNLILTFDGRVKILDFGIALFRDREAPETEHGVVKGKVSYIAPEQLKGQRADRRSDIYSLGVVLHELLTGRKLFTSTTPLQDLIERETAPPPSHFVPGIPKALDEAVMKTLAFDPDKRFQDARDVALALERALTFVPGESVEEFADRELKEERASQRARLSSISSGQEKETVPEGGAASNAIAVESGDVLELDRASGAPLLSTAKAPPTKEGASDLDLSSVTRSRSGGAFVFVLLVAAIAAISVALLAREPELDEEPLADPRRADDLRPTILGKTGRKTEAPPPAEAAANALVAAEAPVPEPPVAEAKSATRTASVAREPPPPVAEAPPPEPVAEAPPPEPVAEAPRPEPVAEPAPPPAKVEVEPRPVAKVEPRPVAKVEVKPEARPRPKSAYPETPPIPPTSAFVASQAVVAKPAKTPVAKAPDPKKKVVAPKPKEPASLSIEASPNAVVLIDGKVVGFTPVNVKLEAGKHEIQVRKPYSRALRWKRTVWARDGQKIELTAPAE